MRLSQLFNGTFTSSNTHLTKKINANLVFRNKRLAIFLALTTFTGLADSSILAQTVPLLPPSTDPSRIQQELQPPPTSQPPPEREINVPSRDELTPPVGSEQQKFRLESLQIQGATVYNSERLQKLYAEFIRRDISLADLYGIANRITQLYRQDGYILSKAIVPEQKISNGRATLQVIEGFIEQVNFQGAPTSQLNRLKGFGDKIVASRPLNVRDLERYLLLANDLAGIEVRGILGSGSSVGGLKLTVNVNYKSSNIFLNLNNRGSKEVGRLRSQAALLLNSLIGGGEQITLSGATTPEDTSELANGALGLSVPIGYEGLKVSLTGSYTGVRPGDRFEQFDINGQSYLASLGLNYPLIRSRSSNLYLNGSFDYIDREVTQNPGSLFLSQDRLRVFRVGMNFEQTDANGAIFGGLQLAQGIGGLGATTEGTVNRPLSRERGSADFTKLNFNLTRLQALPSGLTLELTAAAQLTNDALLVSEQFGLGGDDFGRAFDPSQILGDSGYGVRAELQRQFAYTANGGGQLVTVPYIFYDYGQVFRKFPTASENSSDALSSVGFGIRQSLGEALLLEGELAFPITQTDNNSKQGNRLFFNLRGFF